MVEKIISASTIVLKTALEYSQLASRPDISDDEADRMEYILIEASNDPVLNFWINEIDHCLGHQLGLEYEEINFQCAARQSGIREDVKTFLEVLDSSLEAGKFKSEAEIRGMLEAAISPANRVGSILPEKKVNSFRHV